MACTIVAGLAVNPDCEFTVKRLPRLPRHPGKQHRYKQPPQAADYNTAARLPPRSNQGEYTHWSGPQGCCEKWVSIHSAVPMLAATCIARASDCCDGGSPAAAMTATSWRRVRASSPSSPSSRAMLWGRRSSWRPGGGPGGPAGPAAAPPAGSRRQPGATGSDGRGWSSRHLQLGVQGDAGERNDWQGWGKQRLLGLEVHWHQARLLARKGAGQVEVNASCKQPA